MYLWERVRPRALSLSLSSLSCMTAQRAVASSPTSIARTYTAEFPAISQRLEFRAVTIGVPQAIASRSCMPNPS